MIERRWIFPIKDIPRISRPRWKSSLLLRIQYPLIDSFIKELRLVDLFELAKRLLVIIVFVVGAKV